MYKKIFSVHSWLGLLSGIFILVITISGSLLMFGDDLEEMRIHHLVNIEPKEGEISADEVISIVYENFAPGSMIKGLIAPKNDHSSYMLWVRDQSDLQWKRVYIHPNTGEVLGAVPQNEAFDRWLTHLHYNLGSGKWGLLLVTLIGLVLIASSATGLYVYYKMFKSFSLRKIRWHRKLRIMAVDTHNLFGMIALPFIILITITGLWIIIPFIPHFFETSQGSGESYEFPQSTYKIEELINNMGEDTRVSRLNSIWYPEHEDGIIEVSLFNNVNGQKVKGKLNFLSGQLVEKKGAEINKKKSKSFSMNHLIEQIHFGTFGGIWIKILYALFGFIPAILTITGFMTWYLKKKPKISF